MHPWILREFRMKCGDQMPALLHQHRITFIFCQNLHLRTRAPDDGSADKHRFHIALRPRVSRNRSPDECSPPGYRSAARKHCAPPSCRSPRNSPAPGCALPSPAGLPPRTSRTPASRCANSISGSSSSMKFSSLSMVVLSPPGITRPSMLFSSSAVRTTTASAPARSSAFACASKSPCSARTPTPFLHAALSYQPRVCINSSSGSFEMSRPGIAIPSSSLASRSFCGSL